MPRAPRSAKGGVVYHVSNYATPRGKLFRTPADYAEFVGLMQEAVGRVSVKVYGFCLLPDHWHMLVRPSKDRDLSRFIAWLSNTHVKRFRAAHPKLGHGRLYQSRFKSFPVQPDEHMAEALRYIESRPLSHKLAKRAQGWDWSSLGGADGKAESILTALPARRPRDWGGLVNKPIDPRELATLQTSVARGRPFGTERWVLSTADRLNLGHTLRPIGRPRKKATVSKK